MTWAIAYGIGFAVSIGIFVAIWDWYGEDGAPISFLGALVWPIALPASVVYYVTRNIRTHFKERRQQLAEIAEHDRRIRKAQEAEIERIIKEEKL